VYFITSPECRNVSISGETRETKDGLAIEILQTLVEVKGEGVALGAPVSISLGSENTSAEGFGLTDVRCIS
jgi:hypothetical protein